MPDPARPTSRRKFVLGGGAAALAAIGAAGWAVTPDPQAIEAANPPRGRFVEAEGLRIHYAALGPDDPAAPTAVLIHGATGNLNDMTFDLGPRLAAHGVRVICFDRPGFGYSGRAPVEGWLPATQARVLNAAASALGLGRITLVGHSWGGAVALAWTLLAPERVSGAAILAGASMPWGEPPGFWSPVITSRPFSAVAAGLLRLTALRDDGAAAAARIFRPQAPPPGYMAHLQAELILRPASFQANAEDIGRLDPALAAQSRRYREIHQPMEILHGSADDIVALSVHSAPLSRLVQNGNLEIFQGVGHMIHHAEPEAVVAAARRLLAFEAHSTG